LRSTNSSLLRRHLQRLAAFCLVLAAAQSPATDLATALALAERSDPTYREAQANALAVAEGIPQAKALLWLPQLNFTAGGSHSDQEITMDFALGADGQISFQNYDYRLSLTQPVYFRDRYVRLEQANKRLRQAQAELDAAHQALILRVAERYFEVLAAHDNLAFARAEKDSLEGQLEQARRRFDVGLIAITDVQEAQAGYDRALAQEIVAKNALANADEALREVTGDYLEELSPLGEEFSLERPDPDDIEKWTETALAQNLEIVAAHTATEIAVDEIRAQYAGHFPTLEISGSRGVISQGGRFGQTEIDGGEIGMRINVPLYSGGSVVSKTRQATQEHAAALERLERSRRAVQRATREAFLGIVSQIGSVKALRQAVVSSRTALDSTRAGFEVGTRTTVDVVAGERVLSQARRDYARARYDYVLNRLRLKQAAGTLTPADIVAANQWLAPTTIKTRTP